MISIESFERAMALRPDVWDDLLQDIDEDVLRALVGLHRLIGMTDAETDRSDEFTVLLNEAVPDIIPDWGRRSMPRASRIPWNQFSNIPALSTKVGQNEPCSCGAGKKYKKHCGIN